MSPYRPHLVGAHPTRCTTQLWILKARTDLPRDDNPWLDRWDRCYGMVVEAATEERARRIANTIPLHNYSDWAFEESTAPDAFLRSIEDGDHGQGEDLDHFRGELTDVDWEGKNVWLDSKYTTCEPLVCAGKERRVMWNVVRG